jgi:hypothetical protein
VPYIEVEEVADGEGRIENRNAFAETRQELAFNLIESLLLETQDVQKFL